jgi:hypothetical protein
MAKDIRLRRCDRKLYLLKTNHHLQLDNTDLGSRKDLRKTITAVCATLSSVLRCIATLPDRRYRPGGRARMLSPLPPVAAEERHEQN